MKALLNSCALAALWFGIAGGSASAQTAIREAPIHAIPSGDKDQAVPAMNGPPSASPSTPQTAAPEAAVPVVPPASALTGDEHAFLSSVGRHVTDAASAYEGYVRRASAIQPGFNNPASVRRALRTGADYQPEQFQQGIVAYAALVALRDQAFVDGVRAQAANGLADQLLESPAAVLRVAGAREAAADVAGVLHAHGVALESSGQAITQAAYDVQAQAWSKAPVADPAQVLSEVKASAIHPRMADEPAEKQLLHSLVSAPRAPYADGYAPPQVVRGLALAALAIMGRTGDHDEAIIDVMLHDRWSADCLKIARANLDQCLAAAGPHYEDVFCAGRHAVGETARCVSAAAGGAEGRGPLQADPSLHQARAYGPEEAAAYGYPARHAEMERNLDAPPPTQVADASTPYAAAPSAEPRYGPQGEGRSPDVVPRSDDEYAPYGREGEAPDGGDGRYYSR